MANTEPKIYACLLGEWVCLSDDPDCRIGNSRPFIWFKEEADVYAPFKREKENTYHHLDYVRISYKGKNYRINPIFIQVVNE